MSGLKSYELNSLKSVFSEWITKLLLVGDNLQIIIRQKFLLQHSLHQKMIEPAKVTPKEQKDSTTDSKEMESKQSSIDPKTMITSVMQDFFDIYRIALRSLSNGEFSYEDIQLFLKTNVMGTLFNWESNFCLLECPVQYLSKYESVWADTLKLLHSCCEGVFQWIECEKQSAQESLPDDNEIAPEPEICHELGAEILSTILKRLHTELALCCQWNSQHFGHENNSYFLVFFLYICVTFFCSQNLFSI